MATRDGIGAEFLQELQAFLDERHIPAVVKLDLDRREIRIRLPIAKGPKGVRSSPDDPAAAPARRKLEGHPRLIVDILRMNGHRLTRDEVVSALLDRGVELSERTVDRHLKDLKEAGIVDNRQDMSPPGYGLVS